MPLDGWDHVELWVGNAKQAAYYYEHAFGFRRTAYAGPETGVRDRASYVLEQADIRFVVTSGLREDSEITRFACRHGDGVKDEFGRLEPASIEPYAHAAHPFLNRAGSEGAPLPAYGPQESPNGPAEP